MALAILVMLESIFPPGRLQVFLALGAVHDSMNCVVLEGRQFCRGISNQEIKKLVNIDSSFLSHFSSYSSECVSPFDLIGCTAHRERTTIAFQSRPSHVRRLSLSERRAQSFLAR
jgi:hypothetical protein